MGDFFLAVDGGGSKTEFCLYDRATGETRHFFSGSTNYKISPADAEREAFQEGVARVYSETGIGAERIRGLVLGMSGVDSPEDYARYLQIGLSTGVPEDRIYLCNDSETAFYAEGTPPGLCIIAGTGSCATGVAADRRTARSGGWGTPISDEGSGGWIGIQVLQKLLRYCDGYDVHRPVFDSLREHFGAPTFDGLPRILTLISMQQIAATARLIMDQADAGDSYCVEWVHRAAFLAAEIAASVYAKLAFGGEPSVDVVMAGSLFKCPTYREKFMEEMPRVTRSGNMRFCEEVKSPVLGGIALAKILFA